MKIMYYKKFLKYLLVSVFVVSVSISATPVFAESSSPALQQQLISTLLAQIKMLQEKIVVLQSKEKETRKELKSKKVEKSKKEVTSVVDSKAEKIDNLIVDYLETLDGQILEIKQKIAIAEAIAKSEKIAASKITQPVCAGTKTSNGCSLGTKKPSYNVSNAANGSILTQLLQRKETATVILKKLNEKGSKSITENDKTFLNSVGIKW